MSVESFRVGDWLVEPSLNRLSRGQEIVHLRPRLMDVLSLLAKRAGEVVSSDAIVEAVWAREFVGESLLTRSIAELRTILGDSATQPRFIETVTKRGYRLVAPVEWSAGPPPPAAGARRRWLVLVTALGGIAVVIVASALLWLRARAVRPAGTLDPRLAVVSIFENHTGNPSLDPLGRMAADRISEGLARTHAVRVVPSSRVILLDLARAQGRGSAEDPKHALAEATRAGIVVSGAYYLKGPEILINAQIGDAVAGTEIYQIEPATAPRERSEEALETARRRVMDAVAARYLNGAFDLLAWESKPPSLDAYKEFLVGRELLGVDSRGSASHLARALELDPDFVMPLVYLMPACWLRRDYAGAGKYLSMFETKREQLTPIYRRLLDSRRAMLAGRWEESMNALRDASRLAPTSAFFAFQRGMEAVHANHPREAVAAFTSPLDWTPFVNGSQAWGVWYFQYLTTALHMLGEHERELAEARRGSAVYPDEPYLRACEARALASLGRPQEVDAVIAASLAMPARFETPGGAMLEAALELRAHGNRAGSLRLSSRAVDWLRSRPADQGKPEAKLRALAQCLLLAERWGEARAAYQELAAQHPERVEYRGHLGRLAAHMGDRTEAMQISDELRAMNRPFLFGEHTYQRACIAAQLGEKDQAVELLREAFAQGKPYDLYVHRDIGLEPLRDYAPFQELKRPKD